MRRYQILLPLLFNDGTPVPEHLSIGVVEALQSRFGAVSFETNVIRGHWVHEGQVYRDDLVRLFVDVPDLPEHRAWLSNLRSGSNAISDNSTFGYPHFPWRFCDRQVPLRPDHPGLGRQR